MTAAAPNISYGSMLFRSFMLWIVHLVTVLLWLLIPLSDDEKTINVYLFVFIRRALYINGGVMVCLFLMRDAQCHLPPSWGSQILLCCSTTTCSVIFDLLLVLGAPDYYMDINPISILVSCIPLFGFGLYYAKYHPPEDDVFAKTYDMDNIIDVEALMDESGDENSDDDQKWDSYIEHHGELQAHISSRSKIMLQSATVHPTEPSMQSIVPSTTTSPEPTISTLLDHKERHDDTSKYDDDTLLITDLTVSHDGPTTKQKTKANPQFDDDIPSNSTELNNRTVENADTGPSNAPFLTKDELEKKENQGVDRNPIANQKNNDNRDAADKESENEPVKGSQNPSLLKDTLQSDLMKPGKKQEVEEEDTHVPPDQTQLLYRFLRALILGASFLLLYISSTYAVIFYQKYVESPIAKTAFLIAFPIMFKPWEKALYPIARVIDHLNYEHTHPAERDKLAPLYPLARFAVMFFRYSYVRTLFFKIDDITTLLLFMAVHLCTEQITYTFRMSVFFFKIRVGKTCKSCLASNGIYNKCLQLTDNPQNQKKETEDKRPRVPMHDSHFEHHSEVEPYPEPKDTDVVIENTCSEDKETTEAHENEKKQIVQKASTKDRSYGSLEDIRVSQPETCSVSAKKPHSRSFHKKKYDELGLTAKKRVELELFRDEVSVEYYWECMAQRMTMTIFVCSILVTKDGYNSAFFPYSDSSNDGELNVDPDYLLQITGLYFILEWVCSTLTTLSIRYWYNRDVLVLGGNQLGHNRFWIFALLISIHISQDAFQLNISGDLEW